MKKKKRSSSYLGDTGFFTSKIKYERTPLSQSINGEVGKEKIYLKQFKMYNSFLFM